MEKNGEEINKACNKRNSEVKNEVEKEELLEKPLVKQIIWNIKKALEKNPNMNIKEMLIKTQSRLDSNFCDICTAMSAKQEERHIACALLAWQQLGHSGADSLCQFLDTLDPLEIEEETSYTETASPPTNQISEVTSIASKDFDVSLKSYASGPVVRLPMKMSRIVMRVEKNTSTRGVSTSNSKGKEEKILSKIEAACCLDSNCGERLDKMDTDNKDLRSRALMLARREAERVELLERAEAAWKDLEMGYQRRLRLAQEKEEDLTRQIKRMIEERNANKNACKVLAEQLKEKGDAAENDRLELNKFEKLLYERACTRMKLSEQVAKNDACLTDCQCQVAQIERDIQFKEDQARRKKLNMENELTSAKALTSEAERALREEINQIRNQIDEASKRLQEEDEINSKLKKEIEDLQRNKNNLLEDLESCKTLCDGRMDGIKKELQTKIAKLADMKDKVFDCKCKLPVDNSLQVKRTASLAALCKCAPTDKSLESCSCTSLRERIFSNLLSDLFNGLQEEMGYTGAEMPCHLLKCLEDSHNWDRASVTKTNLKNYFSKLLMSEIDIAIATSIEKYHATWVGECCADAGKPKTECKHGKTYDCGFSYGHGTGLSPHDRVIESRAQSLAVKLAEQLFHEKAEELTKKAKDIILVESEKASCNCKTGNKNTTAVYPCFIQSTPLVPPFSSPKSSSNVIKKTIANVSELRAEIEDLKKEFIKKADLRQMENKLTKFVKKAQENENERMGDRYGMKSKTMSNLNQQKMLLNRATSCKRRSIKDNGHPKSIKQGNIQKLKPVKNTYAVNTCLFAPEESTNTKRTGLCTKEFDSAIGTEQLCIKPNSFEIERAEMPFQNTPKLETHFKEEKLCPKNAVCFHKIPSNRSIDELLFTLKKWKDDLDQPQKDNSNIDKDQSKSNPDLDTKDIKKVDCPSTLENVNTENVSNANEDVNKSDSIINHFQSPSIDREKPETKSFEQERSNSIESAHKLQVMSDPLIEKKLDIKGSKSISFSIQNKENEIDSQNIFDNKDSLNSSKLFTKSESSAEKNTEPDYMTLAKPSIYLADVNLDKSSDDMKNPKLKSKGRNLKNPIPVKTSAKCASTSKCKCNNSSKSKNLNRPLNRKEKTKTGCFIKFLNQEKNKTNLIPKQVPEILVPTKQESIKEKKSEERIESEYDIKFLGVTLTDVDEVKFGDENILVNDILQNKSAESICTRNCLVNKIFNNMACGEGLLGSDLQILKTEKNSIQSNIDKISECTSPTDFKQLSKQSYKNESVDVPSLKSSTYNESCIYCDNKQLNDESKDLEENTYYLLQEHLKEKLEQFKADALRKSRLIPKEEEKDIYTTILNRVKQVISESTNNISCKCIDKGDKTQGSWQRAFDLLQEYLKIKIKRVQCTCPADEQNQNMYLPRVLEKVCRLIENDFQRLKELYGLQSDNDLPEKRIVNVRTCQNNDTKSLVFLNNRSLQISKSIEKENISSQASPYIGMVMKACDPIEFPNKKVQVTGNPFDILSIDSIEKDPDYDNSCNVIDLSGNAGTIHKNIIVKSYHVSKTTSHFSPICMDNFNNTLSKEHMSKQGIENETFMTTTIIETSNGIKEIVDNIDKRVPNESSELNTLDANTSAMILKKVVTNCYVDDTTSYSSETKNTDNLGGAPYTGYTIDCSCDQSIGACVCVKSTFKRNAQIDEMWNKYSRVCTDKSYYTPKIPVDNTKDTMVFTSLSTNYDEIPLKMCEAQIETDISSVNTLPREFEIDASVYEDSDFVLKYSKDTFPFQLLNNTTTNTLDDETSTIADCSKTDDTALWKECLSELVGDGKHEVKPPITLPALEAITCKEHTVIDADGNETKKCNCDSVPLCHVKMLVQNIENKLACSNCTCDSMIRDVCPVHFAK